MLLAKIQTQLSYLYWLFSHGQRDSSPSTEIVCSDESFFHPRCWTCPYTVAVTSKVQAQRYRELPPQSILCLRGRNIEVDLVLYVSHP